MSAKQQDVRRVAHGTGENKPTLSVVIPALNEEEHVSHAIASVRLGFSEQEDVEIIVVDGGSIDDTVRLAKSCDVQVVRGKRGRGIQMNRGAAQASNDWLLFLHADAMLPQGFWLSMKEALQAEQRERQRHPAWGCFLSIKLNTESYAATLVSAAVAWRTSLFSLPYGDQAIFVRKSVFRQVGGYMDSPLMEDVDLVRKLYRLAGRPMIVQSCVEVSARRWERQQWCRGTHSDSLDIAFVPTRKKATNIKAKE